MELDCLEKVARKSDGGVVEEGGNLCANASDGDLGLGGGHDQFVFLGSSNENISVRLCFRVWVWVERRGGLVKGGEEEEKKRREGKGRGWFYSLTMGNIKV